MFIVSKFNTAGLPIPSSTPQIHNEESAKLECERLARANPGITFGYFELKNKCTSNTVSWSNN